MLLAKYRTLYPIFTNVNSLWPSDAIWRQIWVNIGSGNGLFPDGTKPLPEPMLTDHQWSPETVILGQAISQVMPQPSVTKICLKITYVKFNSNFPRVNKLKFVFMFGYGLLVDIDECSSAPCLHGATCNDGVNMYNCTCVSGYNGTHCDVGRWNNSYNRIPV